MKESAKTNQIFCMPGQEMLHLPGYPKVSYVYVKSLCAGAEERMWR